MRLIYKISAAVIALLALVSCGSLKMGGKKEQKVLITTTEGDIKIKLYNETPLHRDNFRKLVKSKFYDGLLFHRVIDEFMIQGGDPESKAAEAGMVLGNGDVGYRIPAEFRTPNLYHKKGALAAARTGDNVNPEKESSGCQFYIVVGKTFNDQQLDAMQRDKTARYARLGDGDDLRYLFSEEARNNYKTIGGTPHLDGNYTVFGEVLEGLEIVEKISKVDTDRADRPLEDVRIIKMKLVRK